MDVQAMRQCWRAFKGVALASICLILCPIASSASGRPEHMTTFVRLSGDYAVQHGVSWETLAPYIDYLDVDQRGSEAAHQAGIKVGFYTDIHLLCRGTTCSGSPQADEVPENGFAHSCSGQRIYTSDDSPEVRKLLGDPRKSELLRSWNHLLDHARHNQYGDFHEDFVIDDDVFIPEADWFVWHEGSPRGKQLPHPYCGYSMKEYISAIKSMEAQAHIPVIFNGLNGPPNVPYIQNAPNVVGGICEDCIHVSYDKARSREPAPLWNHELDAALAAAALKKLWIDYPHGEIDNDTQGYIYASLLLVYSPKYIALHEDIATTSGISLPPTIMLVPHRAIGSTPHTIGALRRGDGVYAREFAQCEIAGYPVGPCATVVNPDPSAARRYPFPRSRYQHSLRILGEGSIRELGDTGRIDHLGAPPPEFLGPRGWAIVFR